MSVSTKLQRIAKMAKEHPTRAFTNLAHHIDLDFLREAFRLTRKDGALGIDGVTGEEYEQNPGGEPPEPSRPLQVRTLPSARRTPSSHPEKEGEDASVGHPDVEDKVLQRAVAMILEAVYEEDFFPCSYGFRPGRSAHDALLTARNDLIGMNGGWVVEADLKDCFGSFDHEWMRDGVLIRTIGKWLNAGIMEENQRTCGFRKGIYPRFEKFGLTLHPEKTRLLPFVASHFRRG